MTFLRIRSLLLIASLMVCCAAPALAWDEPDSFRGVKWGTSADEAEKILKERGDSPHCLSGRACSTRIAIGPVPNVLTIYSFKDDRLYSVEMVFKPGDYPTLKRIFVERYGPPTEEKDEPYQTKGGLKTTNLITRWLGSKVVILLRAYGSRIDEGNGSLMLREELDKRIKESEKAIQKGKGDL